MIWNVLPYLALSNFNDIVEKLHESDVVSFKYELKLNLKQTAFLSFLDWDLDLRPIILLEELNSFGLYSPFLSLYRI